MAPSVHCQNITKRFGDHIVLDDVTWELDTGVLAGLLGASGAGKSTLLRIIAGLEQCSSGRVIHSGEQNLAGRRRGAIGMVFQNLGLWPHLTARQHLHCVLSWLRRSERRDEAERLLCETRLPRDSWDRRPAQLSGGEAQRLALARAIAVNPSLLLLDEPLAQVDMTLRIGLLALIRDLATTRDMTVIYVTHSWHEVSEVCNRLAVLQRGRLVQEGPTGEVFQNPASAAVARLVGPVVEIPLSLISRGRIACEVVPPHACDGGMLLVRPQQIRLGNPCGQNRWLVLESHPFGNGWRITLECESDQLSLATSSYAEPETRISLEVRPTADFAGIGDLPRSLHDAADSGTNRG